jgi:hypothetical protein
MLRLTLAILTDSTCTSIEKSKNQILFFSVLSLGHFLIELQINSTNLLLYNEIQV